MLETFGQRLRQARKKKGLSLEKLAKACGISLASVYNYDRGGRLPNLYTAVCLADALGVSIDWLAGRDGNK